jgi:hypothetical protein
VCVDASIAADRGVGPVGLGAGVAVTFGALAILTAGLGVVVLGSVVPVRAVVLTGAVVVLVAVVAGFVGTTRILLRLSVLCRTTAGRVGGTEVAQETVESVAQEVRHRRRATQIGLRCPDVEGGVRGGNVVIDDGRGVDFASRHECSFGSGLPLRGD